MPLPFIAAPMLLRAFGNFNCALSLTALLSAIGLTKEALTETVGLRKRNCYEGAPVGSLSKS